MPPQTVYVAGLDPHQDNIDMPVRVLNTDTISQTKEKSLDSIYRSTPFSMRPRKDDLDLGERHIWRAVGEWGGQTGGVSCWFGEDGHGPNSRIH